MEMEQVWFVVCMNQDYLDEIMKCWGNMPDAERLKKAEAITMGYFFSKEEALQSVSANACDIHETRFEYAVVFPLQQGFYRVCEHENEQWFKYDRGADRYFPIEREEHSHIAIGL